MSTGLVAPLPVIQITDDAGAPSPGALLYTYLSGTTTPVSVYTDSALSVAHPWPAVADSAGRLTVFMDRAVGYKVEAKTAAGVTLWGPIDNVLLPPDVAPPAANSVPTGTILAFGGVAAPTGYLLCQGQTVSQTVYAALYAVVGTIYNTGGEAGTDFRLPDLQGRYVVGKAAAGTAATLGATFGTMDHVHTGPSHTHAGPTDATPSAVTMTYELAVTGTDFNAVKTVTGGNHTHTLTTTAAGTGNTGTANPPSLVAQYIIKT